MESDWGIKLKSKITTLDARVRFVINNIKHHWLLCVWQTDPTGLNLKATAEREIFLTNNISIVAQLFFF